MYTEECGIGILPAAKCLSKRQQRESPKQDREENRKKDSENNSKIEADWIDYNK